METALHALSAASPSLHLERDVDVSKSNTCFAYVLLLDSPIKHPRSSSLRYVTVTDHYHEIRLEHERARKSQITVSSGLSGIKGIG